MKDVPQIIEETGISADYANEYVGKIVRLPTGIDMVAEIFRKSPVKRYEERFSPDEYANVVTDQNRGSVSRLDEIAATANSVFTDSAGFTEEEFKRTMKEVYELIYAHTHTPF